MRSVKRLAKKRVVQRVFVLVIINKSMSSSIVELFMDRLPVTRIERVVGIFERRRAAFFAMIHFFLAILAFFLRRAKFCFGNLILLILLRFAFWPMSQR